MSIFVVDSYSERNTNTPWSVYTNSNQKLGQSFTGAAGTLYNVVFYIQKFGSPTGNAYAKIYAHSGTYGASSLPTGAALATSDAIDVTTISTIDGLVTFNFSGANQIVLVAGTKYCVSLEYNSGDSSNLLYVFSDATSPAHNGNGYFSDNGTDFTISNYDFCFYIYASGTPPLETADTVISVAKPFSLTSTKIINGAWTAKMQILPDDYMGTENYIDFDDQYWIVKSVKKIKSQGKYYYDVSLEHNMIELAELTLERFTLLKSVEDLFTLILAGSGWTAGTVDIDEIISLITNRRTSRLEALNQLAERCGGELYFHSKTRVVDIEREIGSATGLQLRYDKNCDYIEKEEDSTDLITRLYVYGPDNFEINRTLLDDCEDETLYTASGAGTKAASTFKQSLTQGIQINPAALNETFIRDLGAGGVKDLTGHDSLKFWIYSAVANASGFTFGVGESAYTENTVNTGALTAECWHEIELDLSGVAAASKNAIRYIGFKNLTSGAAQCVFDLIRAFDGNIYIDSDNKSLYKVNKEYSYFHSAKPEKIQFEKILYPTDDAHTREDAANTNEATNPVMGIRNFTSYQLQSFLKFSLSAIPIGATLVSAMLGITVQSISNGGVSADLFLSATNWNENTITWNNQPVLSGSTLGALNMTSTGLKEIDIVSTVNGWYGTPATNYGILIDTVLTATENKHSLFYSKESSTGKPYLKIVYTLLTDPSPVIEAAAREYLAEHEEPKLKYKVKMADLSRAMANTWEDETVNLGDTARIYDAYLGLNVDVRIKKITKNLLDPSDTDIELANKAYTLADIEAKRAKQLSYAMPYADNEKIVDANAVQQGYLGSDVG